MNPIERLELHCKAMEKKYGFLYPLKMDKKELKLNNKLIDAETEYLKNQSGMV